MNIICAILMIVYLVYLVLSVSLPFTQTSWEKSVSSIPTSRTTTIDGVWAACPLFFLAPVLLGKTRVLPRRYKRISRRGQEGAACPKFFLPRSFPFRDDPCHPQEILTHLQAWKRGNKRWKLGRLPLFCLFFPGLSVIPEKLCKLRLYYEADQ